MEENTEIRTWEEGSTSRLGDQILRKGYLLANAPLGVVKLVWGCGKNGKQELAADICCHNEK